MDMMSMTSLAGSVFSTACTAYFWLIKVRRERPYLQAHLVEREIYLGNGSKETRQIGIRLGLVVANYCLLPDALLGARVLLKHKDGSWGELQQLSFDKTTPLPFNLPTLQTVMLRLNGYLTFPAQTALEEAGSSSKVLLGYTEQFLTEPREIRVELQGLNHRKHRATLTYSAAPAVKAAA